MIRIRNLNDIRALPEGPAKRTMESAVARMTAASPAIRLALEEGFNQTLGGDWYLLEPGDDPRRFQVEEGSAIDLLSQEWNWCDAADKEEETFSVFWGINNAGGPCLYVPDEPWLPPEFRSRLTNLVERYGGG
ncbi:hypothetical protein [Geomonas propionica]|uniref:SMI1/KNR4 family protein n=1 Tax=Geomonas propionica TaxID=2798582 RepID=A0ABS0YPB5_9BACT|nr:hypothetical protein [Geomonas propionica]MBJ6799753.1 hypothetical protein [Geomonas propionica]